MPVVCGCLIADALETNGPAPVEMPISSHDSCDEAVFPSGRSLVAESVGARTLLGGFFAKIVGEDVAAEVGWGEEADEGSRTGEGSLEGEGVEALEHPGCERAGRTTETEEHLAPHDRADAAAEEVKARALEQSPVAKVARGSRSKEPAYPPPSHDGAVEIASDATPASPMRARIEGAKSVDEIADEFLAAFEHEDLAAPAAPWGDKVGYSIYDEEELLGPYVDMGQDDDAWIDDLDIDDEEWPEEDEDDQASAQEGAQHLWESDDDDTVPGANAYAINGELPRTARAMKPLCCVGCVTADLPERCPICLEAISAGETAWRLPCMHAFHEVCIVRYLGTRRGATPSCPTCRGEIRRISAATPVQPLRDAASEMMRSDA